jgi:hypothetical protein
MLHQTFEIGSAITSTKAAYLLVEAETEIKYKMPNADTSVQPATRAAFVPKSTIERS